MINEPRPHSLLYKQLDKTLKDYPLDEVLICGLAVVNSAMLNVPPETAPQIFSYLAATFNDMKKQYETHYNMDVHLGMFDPNEIRGGC